MTASDPERAARLIAHLHDTARRAERFLADRGPLPPLFPDVMTPEHPLARALGYEQAKALIDTPGRRRMKLAESRRAEVARLSRDGKLVREIAAELGVSYNYVVELRAALGLGRVR